MSPGLACIKEKLAGLDSQRAALVEWLDSFALLDGQRCCANLESLHLFLNDSDLLAQVLDRAFSAADPDSALNLLERLSGLLARDSLVPVLQDPVRCGQLLTVLGGSPFLAGILCRDGRYFKALFLDGMIDQAVPEATMLAELRQQIPVDSEFPVLKKGLRQYKASQILRIGSRDLCGLATLEEVMEELSGLAAASLQRAYEVCHHQLQEEYGQPLQVDTGKETSPADMTILGMGKFGGNELNFSSDIDLIYCYSSTHGETTGGRRQEVISLHRYFVKLAELVTRALHQVTEDGFVFRVDTRLRPDGNNGDLAISIDGAEAYYESWGQSWERAAMIKARPVAGSIKLGVELLARLKPFVYRRYLDFGMIEDIKLMKQKINASLDHADERERNLKLGHGGIREIEFFIQAHQLVNGGTRPHLQFRNSLRVLNLLGKEGLVSERDLEALSSAYRFLRTVEHRIQIVQEQQTHMLPVAQRDCTVLARRCGFSGCDEFRAQLARHRQEVSAIFKDLFHSADEDELQVRPEVQIIFDRSADPDLVKDILEEKGFSNPDAAYETLQHLRDGDPHKRLTRRGRRSLERLAPLLMNELLDSPNPDQALNNLEAFLSVIRARDSFFALLVENPETVKLLIALFGSSQMLSRIFIQRPELLDTMVSQSHAVVEKSRLQLSSELDDELALAGDYELQLDALRRFRNAEFLRLALNDLHGQVKQSVTARQLSWLAEACLEQACRLARQELAVRFGAPADETHEKAPSASGEMEFAIVGMGKLGGLELNYHSDLDIIFIFSGEGKTCPVAETDPERFRQISHFEYFAKLAQRIISILTLVTREGFVYKIDTRLRPSGNQGPLVTSLDAFLRYHQESAQPWERQAMTKARVVCGPETFCERIQSIIEKLTFERPLPPDLKSEIYRLRGRMEQEIAREGEGLINIKTGRGGMVDVEFITQYLQLLHAGSVKELRQQGTIGVLQCLAEKQLIALEDAEQLIGGYRFLRRLENRLRLLYDQSINELSTQTSALRKVALSLGYGQQGLKPEIEFLDTYQTITEGIRMLLDKYLRGDNGQHR